MANRSNPTFILVRVRYWIGQKSSPERKEMLSSLRMEYRLSEYHLHAYVAPMQRTYAALLDANTAQKIATRVWKAISDLLFRKSNDVHFKKHGQMDSLEGKTNKQGIRFRNGAIHWNNLILPLVVKSKDTYAHEALSQKVKFCRILRKWVRGKVKYYVQVVIDGFPPQKKKHRRQEFCPGLDDNHREKRLLQRKMDRSKRATNPHKFNEDGTPKKKDRTRWIFSKRYQRLRARLREIHRRIAAKRKIWHDTGIGIRIQRDIFSAWLLKNVKDNQRQVDREACLSEFPVFYAFYNEIENQLKIQRPLVASMVF